MVRNSYKNIQNIIQNKKNLFSENLKYKRKIKRVVGVDNGQQNLQYSIKYQN